MVDGMTLTGGEDKVNHCNAIHEPETGRNKNLTIGTRRGDVRLDENSAGQTVTDWRIWVHGGVTT
jgi:hypothetical protein